MRKNIEESTTDNIVDTPTQFNRENSGIHLSIGNIRSNQTPASREKWAEVLDKAERYY